MKTIEVRQSSLSTLLSALGRCRLRPPRRGCIKRQEVWAPKPVFKRFDLDREQSKKAGPNNNKRWTVQSVGLPQSERAPT